MTENSPSTMISQPEQTEDETQTQVEPAKSRLWIVVFFCSIAALAITGWCLWQIHLLQTSNQDQVASFQSTFEQLMDKNNALSAQLVDIRKSQTTLQKNNQLELERAREAWDAQAQALNQEIDDLKNTQSQRVRLNYNKSAQNAIIEALEVAYRKLNFEQDVSGTITLLELVIDKHCQPPSEAALIPVCQALEVDRSALTQVPIPNIGRILLELTSIQHRLAAVQNNFRNEATAQNKEKPGNIQNYSDLKNWRERLGYFKTQFAAFFEKHFVRVHTISDSLTANLTLDQRSFLSQQIILLLEQSKAAALRKDQQLFELTLSQAKAAYTRFSFNERDSRNHIALLDSLVGLELSPELPKLIATYAALSAMSNPGPNTQSVTPTPVQE